MTPDRARVWRKALSIGLATGAYGISFGALSVASGLSVPQTCVLSLLLFSGGSQFAFAGVLGAGGTPLAAAATAALLGVRNGFYACSWPRCCGRRRWRRPLAAQLTIDESTAVAVAEQAADPDRPDLARLGFWATGVASTSAGTPPPWLGALPGNAARRPAPVRPGRRRGRGVPGPALAPAEGRRPGAGAPPRRPWWRWPRCRSPPAGVPVLAAAAVGVLAGLRRGEDG